MYYGLNMDSSLVLLTLAFTVFTALLCVSSSAVHDEMLFYGCFESGDGQVQLHWDGNQITYADFKKKHAVWTAPLIEDLEKQIAVKMDKSPMELKDRKLAVLILTASPEPPLTEHMFTTLYCHIRHFYPPSINVTWTRNGVQVTEGTSLSNLYPQTDGTFSLLAGFSFRPQSGDVLNCNVQHRALSSPLITTWSKTEDQKHQKHFINQNGLFTWIVFLLINMQKSQNS
uniref:Ig-like domain-containing protein n=1 Tax=Amphilophus citrinellus TaxID=61819 RepID=A0A3Q0SXN6_AMPCI